MQLRPRSQRMRRVRAWCGVFGGLLLGACLPLAAQAGADCSISSVALAFGAYDTTATSPDDTAATVTVTCVYVPPGASRVGYTIRLSHGMNGTSATTRKLANGSSLLPYNVYSDASRTRVWGDGSAGTVVATGSMTVGPGAGNGKRTASHVVYGRIPALQDAVPGTYLDALVLMLDY